MPSEMPSETHTRNGQFLVVDPVQLFQPVKIARHPIKSEVTSMG